MAQLQQRKRRPAKLTFSFNYKKIGLLHNMMVKVMAGDDKGLCGKVMSFNKTNGMVKVEGVNLKMKSVKKTKEQAGQFTKVQHGVHVSNLKVLDKDDNFISLRKINKDNIVEETVTVVYDGDKKTYTRSKVSKK
jgi:ribosomal protein L24